MAAFLLISCPQAMVHNPYEDLPRGTFWAQDLASREYYTVEAALLAEGEKCVVWAERNSGVSVATGEAIAGEYDSRIYDLIVGTFGSDEAMASGDVDGDGKLTLLLLDIKDGFKGSGAYTAGYFNYDDLLASSSNPYSNKKDMIYVDAAPSTLPSEASYATIAHELQHFINIAARSLDGLGQMDAWIDEGLSAAAEYLYLGKHNTERIDDFVLSETVRQGNNFFVWGNRVDGLLDEYATVYLFFQWLRIQSGGTDLYKRIIASPHYDYRAVVEAISGTFAEELGSVDWETILRSWLGANYINSTNGLYGYHGELPKLHVYAIGGQTQGLLPGEGVYSSVIGASGSLPSGGGPNIRYAGLRKAAGFLALPSDSLLSLNTLSLNERLLTFNSNASNDWSDDWEEIGFLTGARAEAAPRYPSIGLGRSARQDSWIIDARDIMGRPGR
jgi:hypothetical protein